MKNFIIALGFVILAQALPAATPTPTFSPTPSLQAPTGVRLGIFQPSGAIRIYWDIDPMAFTWVIAVNGTPQYTVKKSDLTVSDPQTYTYLMQGFPQTAAMVMQVTIFAQAQGKTTSPPSQSVVFITPAAPSTYQPPPSGVISEIFTDTGVGKVYAYSPSLEKFFITIYQDGGTLSSWDVFIQGSLDGVNFTNILEHYNGFLTGQIISTGANFNPYNYLRINCQSIELGTATDLHVVAGGRP